MDGVLGKLRSSSLVKGTIDFFGWWREALVATLPDRWRDVLAPQPVRLLARVVDDEVLLQRDANGGEELGRFAIDDDREMVRQVVLGTIAKLEEQPHSWLLIGSEQVLRRTIAVPVAAEENLRAVLGYEMDRHTPFPADQVHFDYRIIGRSEDGQQLSVELIIVRRDAVEAPVALVSERGLALEGVDVVTEDAERQTLGVNLLPPAQRARANRKQLGWNLLLGAAFVGLLYLVMWQSIEARERAIAELDERVALARTEANRVSNLRQTLADSQAGASFLTDLKQTQPVVTRLLSELTRALPDDTSLQRLQISRERVELNGEAPEPAKLIALLEAMECIQQPAPKSAYTPNRATGKERFVIGTDIDCAPQSLATQPSSTGAR